MAACTKYTQHYLLSMSRLPLPDTMYRPRKTELPLFEAANYLLAWTDEVFRTQNIEENEYIDLIVELRPLFRSAFGCVDSKDRMVECISSRQNQYAMEFSAQLEPNERQKALHRYLNEQLLRAEVEESLFLSAPWEDSKVANDSRMETASRAALASLEQGLVTNYLDWVRALVQRSIR